MKSFTPHQFLIDKFYKKTSLRNGAGFTLVEAIITVSIFALIMGVTIGFIFMAYRTHGYTWGQSVAIDEARRGIETMVREIRNARPGDDGSYPIELADDKEFIFYSDIDEDKEVERVRYFLGTVKSGSQVQDCVSFAKGGTCTVSFSNFLQGTLKSAQVKVSVEGDFGASNEYAEIYADGTKLGNLCQTGCTDCAGTWQGTTIFDVANQASDNFIQFMADATFKVDPFCSWENPFHSMKAQYELSWTEEIAGAEHEFKKGVINPVEEPGPKISYPPEQEEVMILSSYVRNTPPIFEYFDQNGNKIGPLPARLKDTKLMGVYLVVNVNPNRPPQDFELESWAQLRNLKLE